MLRKMLKILGFLMLMAFLVVTLAFSSKESRNVACREIEIQFRSDESIRIGQNEITGLVKGAEKQIIGKQLRNINSELIEKEVEKHPVILNAEVFKLIIKDSLSYSGILGVQINHREP